MDTKQLQKNSAKTPTLRFAGFSGAWEEKKLGKIATFAKGKGISKDDAVEGGKYKCIRYGELYTQYKEIINEVYSRTNVLPADSFLSQKDDVIIPASGETALDIATTSCVKESGILLGGDINVLRFNKEQSGDFLAYYLKNFKNRGIARLAQGQSVVHLYSSQLKELILNTPTLPEQQKIASFLESVDGFIENLQMQKDALQEYKKGMMQKIFSQEIRFNDENGNPYPDWKVEKLSSFLIERNEKAPKSDQYPLMAFVAYKGVTPKGERYNREFLVNDTDNKNYKRTEYGDFIYSSNNLETGSIGLNRFGSASISPVYSIFKIGQSCDCQFMSSFLVRKSFINKMIRYRQGVVYGQWRIHESDFLKIGERIPSIKEQQKIASFLISIDDLIEAKDEQPARAREWKKGLMQGLFI